MEQMMMNTATYINILYLSHSIILSRKSLMLRTYRDRRPLYASNIYDKYCMSQLLHYGQRKTAVKARPVNLIRKAWFCERNILNEFTCLHSRKSRILICIAFCSTVCCYILSFRNSAWLSANLFVLI